MDDLYKKIKKMNDDYFKTESIPIYPKLFTYKNNKIYQWSIKIINYNDGYKIITEHGQKDGKMITHEKEILTGKAKRTVLEQTILYSKSKWNDKKNKELYVEDLNQNSQIVRPMLANKFSFQSYEKDGRAFKILFPVFIQKKYDGIRCLSYLKDNHIIMESRKGIEFENFEQLKKELYDFLEKKPKNFYIDGELYSKIIDFHTVSGLIRLTNQKATPEEINQINSIEYHIYDCIDLDNIKLGYQERYKMLIDMFKYKENKLIKLVDTIEIEKLEDVKKYHDKFVADGFEGIIIRDKNGPYEIQKRSKFLQKYKEFMEDEFKIIGFHEGEGDEKGAIIWDCITPNNRKFSVRPKGTFEYRKKLFKEGDKYIGKNLTVIYQELTIDSIPRFPVGKGVRENF